MQPFKRATVTVKQFRVEPKDRNEDEEGSEKHYTGRETQREKDR